jgi:hypothetical protein
VGHVASARLSPRATRHRREIPTRTMIPRTKAKRRLDAVNTVIKRNHIAEVGGQVPGIA